MKKRILTIVLVLILIAGMVPGAFADDGGNATVKAGFFAYPGYHETENGMPGGYGYEFLQLLRRYTDLNFELTGYESSWADMQQMLLDGEIDLVTSARKTPEREELFDFSEPIGTNSAQINVRADDGRFIPGDFKSLNGKTIGELSGNSRNADVERFAQDKGFKYRIREYATAEDLEQALQSGEVDAIATSSLRKSRGELTVAEFAPESFYVIVKKGNTELLDEINYGINQMDVNEGNWRDDLYYKNYTQDEFHLVFTQREKDFINEVQSGKRNITVTARPDSDPYSFVENGELKGIIPDYFAQLMELAGLPYEVEIAADRQQFDSWMKTNHTDVVMDYRFGAEPIDSDGFGVLTDPFMQLTTSRVTKKGFSGSISSVAAIDSRGIEVTGEDFAENLEYKYYPSREETMQAVKDGEADACYVYSYMAEKFINTDPENKLQATVLQSPVYDEYIYISPKSSHELAGILNKCIKAAGKGTLDSCVSKYTNATYSNISLMQYIRMNPDIMILIAAILAIFGILIAANIIRTRTVNLREEQLAHEKEYERALEAANKSKSDFLFNMSHDIRTPMNAIIGFTNLAKKHIDDRERVEDSLDKIESSGQHLLQLINEVLDMSRVESGKLSSEVVTANITEEAKRLVSICRENAEQQGITINFVEKNIVHDTVRADALHINQIIMNILGNAVKYSGPGGTVDYTIEEVPYGEEGFGRYICTVEDDGIGMSKEFLEHIFDAFSREDNASTSKVEGTGLGMAIVKRLVDLMGGDIKVESEQGKGTRVTVTLDLQFAENAGKPEKSAEAKKTAAAAPEFRLKGGKVLLVEDNELNREIATEILEDCGLTVETAVNGEEAVNTMTDRGPYYYDFILMDIQMPVMDGYEATRRIRQLQGGKHIPIVALSANAFEEDKKASLEAGMNGHVAKPIDIKELFTTLEKFL